jgi:hypothetical protein
MRAARTECCSLSPPLDQQLVAARRRRRHEDAVGSFRNPSLLPKMPISRSMAS